MIIKGSMNYDQFGRKLKEKESSVRLVRSGRLPVEQLARVQIPYGAPRNLALRKRSFLKDLNPFRVILHQKQIGNLKKVENILWLQHTTREPIKLYLKMK